MNLIFLTLLIFLLVLYLDLNERILGIEKFRRAILRKKPDDLSLADETQPKQTKETAFSPLFVSMGNLTKRTRKGGGAFGSELTRLLCEDWVLKLGALLVMLSYSWYLIYAFSQEWVSPSTLILLGGFSGVLFFVLGIWRMKTSKYQGSIFTAFGGGVILFSLFIARDLYGLFLPSLALLAVGVTSAYVAYVSVSFRVRWLSLAGLLIAGIAPLLVSFSDPNFPSLFSYLLAVVFGTLSVVYISGFRGLSGIALLIVSYYSIPALMSGAGGSLFFFANIFALIFLITSALDILKQKKKEMTSSLLTVTGAGLFILLWVFFAGGIEWQTTFLLAWMGLFALGGLVTYELTERKEVLLAYGGVALTFLLAVVAFETQGAAFSIALTAMAALATIGSYYITKRRDVVNATSVLFVVPAMYLFGEFGNYLLSDTSIFSGELLSILFFALVVFGVGYFCHCERCGKEDRDDKSIEHAFFIAAGGSVYLLYWIFFEKLLGSGASLTVAITALNAFAIIGTYRATKNLKITHYSTLLLVFPFLMTLSQFILYAGAPLGVMNIIDEHFFALFFFGAVLFGLGVFFRKDVRRGGKATRDISNALFVLSAVYGLALLWLVFARILENGDLTTIFTLACFSIFGLVGYTIGLLEKKRLFRLCGVALLLFVVFHLMIIDVWQMANTMRVAVFFVVGALFLGMAFLMRWKRPSWSGKRAS